MGRCGSDECNQLDVFVLNAASDREVKSRVNWNSATSASYERVQGECKEEKMVRSRK